MSIEEKASGTQEKLEAKFTKIGTGRYGRIIRMCRTPTGDQYKKSLIVVAVGLSILGIVGFAIYWVMSYLPGYF